MKLFQAKNNDDFVAELMQMVEQDMDKEIFTIRILGEDEGGLETLVVFKDESIMMGNIKVEHVFGQIAIRMQGNFI